MSKITFNTFIDMASAATPSSGYLVAYDLDGMLKQKDQYGVVSLIGATGAEGPIGPTGIGVTGSTGATGSAGPTPSFSQVLAIDNSTVTYDIIMGTGTSIRSNDGNGQIDLDFDGTESHIYITSDSGALLEGVLEVSNHYSGLAAKNYFMGFESYDLLGERVSNLWSTYTSSVVNIGVSRTYYSTYQEYQDISVHENTTYVYVSDFDRHAIFIGTRYSGFAAGITNSVIIGGYSMSATESNTVYLGNKVNINNAYTLPSVDGTSNQVLKTNGSGVVTWQTDTTGSTPSLSQVLSIGNNDGGYSITMNTSSYISDTSLSNSLIFNDGYGPGGLSITTDGGLFQKSWVYLQRDYFGYNNYVEIGAIATASSTATVYLYVSDEAYVASSSLYISDDYVSLYKTGTPFYRSISIYDNMIQTLGNEEHLGWINMAYVTIGGSYYARLNLVENQYVGTENYVLRTSTDNTNVIFGVRANNTVHIGTTGSSATFSYINGSQGAGKYLQSDANGNATWATISGGGTVSGNGVTASGTINYVSKFTATNVLSDSIIYDNGTNVGIGTASPSYRLTVSGTVSTTGFRMTNGASTNFILRSDANGVGTWTASSNVFTQSLAQTLVIGNTTGASDIIVTSGQVVKSSSGDGQINFDWGTPSIPSYVAITSDGGNGLRSLLEISDVYSGISNAGKDLDIQPYMMGLEMFTASAISSTGSNISSNTVNLWSTGIKSLLNIGVAGAYSAFYMEYQDISLQENSTATASVTTGRRQAIFIGTNNSTISPGVTNSVIIGGANLAATQSNTVYVPTLVGRNVITDAFRLTTSPGLNRVLTSDSNGVGTWQSVGTASGLGSVNKYSTTILNSSISIGVPISVTHSLSSTDITSTAWDVSLDELVYPKFSNRTTSKVDVTFTSIPTGDIRVVITS